MLIIAAKSLLPCKIHDRNSKMRGEGCGTPLRILAATLYYSYYFNVCFSFFHHFLIYYMRVKIPASHTSFSLIIIMGQCQCVLSVSEVSW